LLWVRYRTFARLLQSCAKDRVVRPALAVCAPAECLAGKHCERHRLLIRWSLVRARFRPRAHARVMESHWDRCGTLPAHSQASNGSNAPQPTARRRRNLPMKACCGVLQLAAETQQRRHYPLVQVPIQAPSAAAQPQFSPCAVARACARHGVPRAGAQRSLSPSVLLTVSDDQRAGDNW
jgi:hypothetical protein